MTTNNTGGRPVKPRDTTFYIVYWFEHAVLKIGVTNRADRLRKHALTGGKTLHVVPHMTTRQEREAIRHVGYAFDRAFTTAASAVPVLGDGGLGFSECFTVPTRHILGAVELAFMGVRRSADETDQNDQARILHQ